MELKTQICYVDIHQLRHLQTVDLGFFNVAVKKVLLYFHLISYEK